MCACEHNDVCAICLTNKSNVFLPACGHLCVCDICAIEMHNRTQCSNEVEETDDENDEDDEMVRSYIFG
jgi:hypothetical protein